MKVKVASKLVLVELKIEGTSGGKSGESESVQNYMFQKEFIPVGQSVWQGRGWWRLGRQKRGGTCKSADEDPFKISYSYLSL